MGAGPPGSGHPSHVVPVAAPLRATARGGIPNWTRSSRQETVQIGPAVAISGAVRPADVSIHRPVSVGGGRLNCLDLLCARNSVGQTGLICGMTRAEYFDQWYANMAASPTHEDIAIRTLGLPPGLESTSLLPWDGISDVTDALGVGSSELLVDLACGRGTALHDAGFVDVTVKEMPEWRAAELAHWQAAAAIDPAGDAALESLRDEGVRTLARIDRIRRVLAVSRVPHWP